MSTEQSRRSLIRRGLIGAAAAIGLGAGAGVTASRTSSAVAEAPETRLRLEGRGWTLQTPGRRLGDRIEPGDRGTVHGELLDTRGRVVGSFLGSRLAAPLRPGDLDANASVELHTFTLEDGTILGLGSVLPGAGVFAVVGGSGRYAGLRGSYTARQGIPELGGDGTATFDLNLKA